MNKDDWKLLAWIVWRLKFPLVVGAAFWAGHAKRAEQEGGGA